MHIPDGFLAAPVWVSLDVAAIPAIGYFARRVQRSFDETKAPLLGVLGAFVFAAQMVNFPVLAGTSGHLIGAALLALTLGPSAAAVVMSAVLAVQALVFQDGGLLALGANIFNLAIVAVWAGYLPMALIGDRGPGARRWAAFAGGWFSVTAAALAASVQLHFSQVAPAAPLFASMLGVHAVTGVIEGLLTAACLTAIERLHPNLAYSFQRP